MVLIIEIPGVDDTKEWFEKLKTEIAPTIDVSSIKMIPHASTVAGGLGKFNSHDQITADLKLVVLGKEIIDLELSNTEKKIIAKLLIALTMLAGGGAAVCKFKFDLAVPITITCSRETREEDLTRQIPNIIPNASQDKTKVIMTYIR